MGKLTFLVGLGTGYVLGAKAGRARYEQIKTRTDQLWGHPKVRERRNTLGHEVKARAPHVAASAGSAAIRAAGEAIMASPPPEQVDGTTRPAAPRHTGHSGPADRTIPRDLA